MPNQLKDETLSHADTQSPAELRNIFGTNLRILAQDYPSIAELSRQLGVNRTQLNRYLSGDSFPRPDILAKICDFFEIDARILLEPIDAIRKSLARSSAGILTDFLGLQVADVSEDLFPSGFYRFARRSFINPDDFVTGLLHITRSGTLTYLRGYETIAAMQTQDLPTSPRTRVFGGQVFRQENGIAIFAARRNAMTSSFNYLTRVGSFENNFWVGYVTRTVGEGAVGIRATRLVYDYLGSDFRRALHTRRAAGFCKIGDLSPFQRRLLRPDEAFS
ncbi:MAG: transcriptional regulator with XRE-family HTH domain [Sulfitobacter sp.]